MKLVLLNSATGEFLEEDLDHREDAVVVITPGEGFKIETVIPPEGKEEYSPEDLFLTLTKVIHPGAEIELIHIKKALSWDGETFKIKEMEE